MKRKLSAYFIFIMSAATLVAFKPVSNNNNNGSSGINSDTTVYEIDSEELMDVNDSMFIIPAYDFYCQWDTSVIHPYKFGQEAFLDSTTIFLGVKNQCGYAPPFRGTVSSEFGFRKKRYHYGVDIKLETGDSVACAFDGMVRIAKKNKTYGNVVVVRHKNGLETYYAHLSKIHVEAGQIVHAGEILGLGGNTGHSYGSHLHFEVRYKGKPINPSLLISFNDHTLISDSLSISKSCFTYPRPVKYKYTSSKKKKKTSPKGKAKGVVKAKATAHSGSKVHVVKKGETLYSIAKRYKLSTDKLCKTNGLRSNSVLKVGRRLKV
jgi:murein DD-endopeptidase MepM/ murein hydrolase activator NlpD